MNQVLKSLRIAEGYSAKDLADKLGIKPPHLCRIEAGTKSPSPDLLRSYSKVFHIPVSQILFFSETQNEQKLGYQKLLQKILDELIKRKEQKRDIRT
jgi:transcriptional regulator with XRE-family HTH domain